VVSGVAYSKNEAKITVVKVPDRPGIAAKIFKPLSEANIVVDVIVQNVSVTGFTTLRHDRAHDYKKGCRSPRSGEDVGPSERRDDKIAKVSIVGMAMRSHSGVALKVFETLAAEGINILGIPPRRSDLRTHRGEVHRAGGARFHGAFDGETRLSAAHRTRKTRPEGRDVE